MLPCARPRIGLKDLVKPNGVSTRNDLFESRFVSSLTFLFYFIVTSQIISCVMPAVIATWSKCSNKQDLTAKLNHFTVSCD
jgi:hypothetical protein